MAWIESHQEVGRHPKTKKLARKLGVSIPAAVGHLHFLWWWALDFAHDGVLDKFDSEDIAEAMEWDGDSEQLLEALIDSGYIDETDHGLVIHDWGEYAGKLLERRAKDRERKRAAAEAAGVPKKVRGKSTGKKAEEIEITGESAEQTPYKAIVDMYHDICKSYSKLRNISDSRKKAIAARWKEYGQDLDTFRELFELAEASPFLKGKNQKNWTADFNWLMNSENMAKVLEGKYNDKAKEGQPYGEYSANTDKREREGTATAPSLSGFHMATG